VDRELLRLKFAGHPVGSGAPHDIQWQETLRSRQRMWGPALVIKKGKGVSALF
jgi:hypothetical protein